MEQSITLSAQAYIEAKTSHNLAFLYDAWSPIMECTPEFLLCVVYNVINTSIQSQTQYSHRIQISIVYPTGYFLATTIIFIFSTGWCSTWQKWNCWQHWRGWYYKFKFPFLTFLFTCFQPWINPLFGSCLSKLILIFVPRVHSFLLAHLKIQFVGICQE